MRMYEADVVDRMVERMVHSINPGHSLPYPYEEKCVEQAEMLEKRENEIFALEMRLRNQDRMGKAFGYLLKEHGYKTTICPYCRDEKEDGQMCCKEVHSDTAYVIDDVGMYIVEADDVEVF